MDTTYLINIEHAEGRMQINCGETNKYTNISFVLNFEDLKIFLPAQIRNDIFVCNYVYTSSIMLAPLT